MRAVLAILIVLAAVAAALFALGVFDGPAPAPENVPFDGPDAQDPPENGTGLSGGTNVPEDMPQLEFIPIREPLQVLLLTGFVERLPATLAMYWGSAPSVTVHAWVENVGEEGRTPGVESLKNVEALEQSPIPADLDDLDIDVVVLHGLSAEALDADFWEAVSLRVREGRIGLIAMPGRPDGLALFENPALAELLPVAKAGRFEGSPIPGKLGDFRAFEITEAGTTHPASRLVAWPEWSRTMWMSRAEAPHPWGTSMTWPVEEATEDGAVLLRVAPARGDGFPVMLAREAGAGRVLFFGAFEILPRDGYGVPKTMEETRAWLNNWLAWAGGRD